MVNEGRGILSLLEGTEPPNAMKFSLTGRSMILPSPSSPLKSLGDMTHFHTSLVQSRSPVPEIAESSEQGIQCLTPNLGYLLGMLYPCISYLRSESSPWDINNGINLCISNCFPNLLAKEILFFRSKRYRQGRQACCDGRG